MKLLLLLALNCLGVIGLQGASAACATEQEAEAARAESVELAQLADSFSVVSCATGGESDCLCVAEEVVETGQKNPKVAHLIELRTADGGLIAVMLKPMNIEARYAEIVTAGRAAGKKTSAITEEVKRIIVPEMARILVNNRMLCSTPISGIFIETFLCSQIEEKGYKATLEIFTETIKKPLSEQSNCVLMQNCWDFYRKILNFYFHHKNISPKLFSCGLPRMKQDDASFSGIDLLKIYQDDTKNKLKPSPLSDRLKRYLPYAVYYDELIQQDESIVRLDPCLSKKELEDPVYQHIRALFKPDADEQLVRTVFRVFSVDGSIRSRHPVMIAEDIAQVENSVKQLLAIPRNCLTDEGYAVEPHHHAKFAEMLLLDLMKKGYFRGYISLVRAPDKTQMQGKIAAMKDYMKAAIRVSVCKYFEKEDHAARVRAQAEAAAAAAAAHQEQAMTICNEQMARVSLAETGYRIASLMHKQFSRMIAHEQRKQRDFLTEQRLEQEREQLAFIAEETQACLAQKQILWQQVSDPLYTDLISSAEEAARDAVVCEYMTSVQQGMLECVQNEQDVARADVEREQAALLLEQKREETAGATAANMAAILRLSAQKAAADRKLAQDYQKVQSYAGKPGWRLTQHNPYIARDVTDFTPKITAARQLDPIELVPAADRRPSSSMIQQRLQFMLRESGQHPSSWIIDQILQAVQQESARRNALTVQPWQPMVVYPGYYQHNF